MGTTAPTKTARDRLGRRVRFAAAVAVVASAALFAWSLATARHHRLPTGGGLGADLLAFYDAGDLLRRFGPGRLYDLPLQSFLYHDQLPGEPADVFLPYAYAPQVAIAFAALARLSYPAAYVAWTLVSIAAYAAAVVVAVRAARLPAGWRSTAWWAAAGFEPFAFECVHGGQISTVATALLSIAAALSIAGRPFAAGLAVGCCCYKPTLLVIVLPGLVLTRRWRAVAGCAVAVAAWAAFDLVAVGVGPCRMYATLLAGYAGRSPLEFRTWKFVDVHSFAVLLGCPPAVATGAVIAAVGAALIGLRRPGSADDERLFWAAALAWTPVANLYAGSYDAVLAVPAAVLAAGVLHRRHGQLPGGFVVVIAAAWVAPWVTSATAQACGVQVLTVALAVLAVCLTKLARSQPSADAARPVISSAGPRSVRLAAGRP